MKILQINHSKGFGGAQMLLLKLSAELLERGNEILVVAQPGSWLESEAISKNIPFTPIKMYGDFNVACYWKLRHLIQTWHPDIINAHQEMATRIAAISRFALGVKLVATIHSVDRHRFLNFSDKIIAVADAVRENLIRQHYAPEKIIRIYNGVSDEPCGKRAELRQELNIPAEQFAMVCVGRFAQVKGQDILAAALSEIPKRIHCYFIGDENTEFGKRIVSTNSKNERMHFLGYRRDTRRILSAFDFAVQPSRSEAFSLTLLESACASLPVIATRVGGNPELVVDGETGILVPPENPEALAQAIMKFAGDSELREKMGRAARERYEQNFTIEKMTAQVEALYRELAGSR